MSSDKGPPPRTQTMEYGTLGLDLDHTGFSINKDRCQRGHDSTLVWWASYWINYRRGPISQLLLHGVGLAGGGGAAGSPWRGATIWRLLCPVPPSVDPDAGGLMVLGISS